MPGKLNIGLNTTPPDHAFSPKNAAAYCEGRQVALNGGDAGDNPHEQGSEASEAWANGFINFANPLFREGCAV
jgi:hypothetical protein